MDGLTDPLALATGALGLVWAGLMAALFVSLVRELWNGMVNGLRSVGRVLNRGGYYFGRAVGQVFRWLAGPRIRRLGSARKEPEELARPGSDYYCELMQAEFSRRIRAVEKQVDQKLKRYYR